MEKEPCAKFCGVLLSFREVIKLQSFESGESDVIPACIQNISFLFFFCIFLLMLWKKNFLHISHELMKL